MSEQIDAIYDGGVLKPVVPLSLRDKARVTLTIDAASQPAAALPWSEFVERTYGSCAGQGLERPDQGALDPREPIA
jgi:predicted DNA-binding antitoxin AbrB/MazE fold protein